MKFSQIVFLHQISLSKINFDPHKRDLILLRDFIVG